MLSLLRDEDLIGQAREAAQQVVEADPDLTEHALPARLTTDLLNEERAQFLDKVEPC